MARTRVTHVVGLYDKVKSDPRVKAAQAAKDAFYASEHGQLVQNTKTLKALHQLDDDLLARFEAHLENYTLTYNAVKMEILIAEDVVQVEQETAAAS